jgi:hypothetical protein
MGQKCKKCFYNTAIKLLPHMGVRSVNKKDKEILAFELAFLVDM